MLNERQRVRKAIRFEKPDRVPMLHFNFDKEDSDIVLVDIQQHFGGADGLQSEWGFVWERVDGTMGQVREPLLKTERDAAACARRPCAPGNAWRRQSARWPSTGRTNTSWQACS